jgi:hypothetical protein
MNDARDRRQTRRELFASAIRYTTLGGIAALSVELIRRGDDTSADGQCRRTIACAQCELLADCPLSQARAARPTKNARKP